MNKKKTIFLLVIVINTCFLLLSFNYAPKNFNLFILNILNKINLNES
jgi:hypothetical protein